MHEALKVAEEIGAIPYDIPGADMSHVDELFSFDEFVKKYQLNDFALQQLAHAMVMYDALYRWCKACQAETHNGPPQS